MITVRSVCVAAAEPSKPRSVPAAALRRLIPAHAALKCLPYGWRAAGRQLTATNAAGLANAIQQVLEIALVFIGGNA
jgi:hypothetical protein